MLELIEKDECAAGPIEGGTILEVGKGQIRLVLEKNDPGPSGPGHTVHGNAQVTEDILNSQLKPGWGKLN
jgi:hypothetical protein